METSHSGTMRRLMHDYMQLKRDPLPQVQVEIHPENVYEWHFVFKGTDDTLLSGGFFHGKLLFPTSFPFQPPQIVLITPADFQSTSPSTSDCLFSLETWSPAFSVRSVLSCIFYKIFTDSRLTTGRDSTFTSASMAAGSGEIPLDLSKDHAKESNRANLLDRDFRALFPRLVDQLEGSEDDGDYHDDDLSDMDDDLDYCDVI